jgi:Mg2+ and Co2+ transporter CorA
MGEVLTALEVALCVSSVVKGLYEYVNSVKEAKDDIHRLTQELFTLKGALEHFAAHSDSGADTTVQTQVQEMLRMTQDTLEGLQGRLAAHKSRFSRAMGRLTWPFKSGEVQKHVDSIERSKTWFIMVILRDSTDRTVLVYDEMKKLSAVISEDIIERQTSKMFRETEDLLKWLAPSDSEEQLAMAAKKRTRGTGQWFLSGDSEKWLHADKVEQPFMWITGKTGAGKTLLL